MINATWRKIFDSDLIRRSSQTVAVVDSRIYVYGGELRPREPVDSDIHVLTISDDQRQQQPQHEAIKIDSSPLPRVGSISTALNSKLYIFSGRGGTAMAPIEENGCFWVFEPKQQSWTQVSPEDTTRPFPAGRSYHSVCNDGVDTIYIHAGCPENGRLSDLWAFSVSKRTWTELAPAPSSGRGGTSIAFHDGKIYRMNGFDGKSEQGGAIDVYDMKSNTWTTVIYSANEVSGPSPRSVGCLLSLEIAGKSSLVTMFGECDPSSLGHQGAGKMLGDIWQYELEAGVWSQVKIQQQEATADVPCGRGWFDADVLRRGDKDTIVVHGGLDESNARLGDVWTLEF